MTFLLTSQSARMHNTYPGLRSAQERSISLPATNLSVKINRSLEVDLHVWHSRTI